MNEDNGDDDDYEFDELPAAFSPIEKPPGLTFKTLFGCYLCHMSPRISLMFIPKKMPLFLKLGFQKAAQSKQTQLEESRSDLSTYLYVGCVRSSTSTSKRCPWNFNNRSY